MKRRRDFSIREQRMIDGFIEDICRLCRLPLNDRDLRQSGWAAFLSVYRDDPAAFSGSAFLGWRRAYLIIWDALMQERRWREAALYKTQSLDVPVSREIPVSRIELLQAPHGDFQNSVCFHDYLERIDADARRMAYALIGGGTLEEIGGYYDWIPAHTYRTYNRLRKSMEDYLHI